MILQSKHIKQAIASFVLFIQISIDTVSVAQELSSLTNVIEGAMNFGKAVMRV